jgi:hypothetical protein
MECECGLEIPSLICNNIANVTVFYTCECGRIMSIELSNSNTLPTFTTHLVSQYITVIR